MASKIKPRSRVAKSSLSKKGKFHFRWWMALILVLVVGGIGLLILRFSNASSVRKWYSADGNEIHRPSYVVSQWDPNLGSDHNLGEVIKAWPGQQIFDGPNGNITGASAGVQVCWYMAGYLGPANVTYGVYANGGLAATGQFNLSGAGYENQCVTTGPLPADSVTIRTPLTNNGPSPVWWNHVTVQGLGGGRSATQYKNPPAPRSNPKPSPAIASGTIYITKYGPHGPAIPDGNLKAKPETVPGNTGVCAKNKQGSTFACSGSNPIVWSGIWVSGSPYTLYLTPPTGWHVSKSMVNQKPVKTANEIKASVKKDTDTFVDFYFDQ